MTVPPSAPQAVRAPRRFELRSTAVYFVLLALLLTLAVIVGRTVAAAAQARPGWAVALLLLASAGVVAGHRGRRRFSAARVARRAARSLEAATETVVEALETAPPAPAPDARHDIARTVQLTEPVEPPVEEAVAVTEAIVYEELDPDEFEQAIAELCRRDGCTAVEVVGGAGDLGADVIGRTPDGRALVVQCKRYSDSNRVGSQDMQRFGGTCYTVHGAEVAAVVTTGDFTAPALEYAQQCGIVCVDGDDLWHWQTGTGPAPWELEQGQEREPEPMYEPQP
ncbi:restriction endonuclease [Streptomyces sp. MBT97]|uniref:restriction endonuclease n=1 Tax=Streptomyces sp. MBT97 TaxID=2800411 RepID=UPI00190A7CCF|nr:restriction endonuclease [Streptomyces sp. MBT97]MBK3638236.1 restriction endonuclease [Streptomyces sp. MBT97]